MPNPNGLIVLNDFSAGRQGATPPLSPDFPPNGVVDAVNVDWYRTRGLRKRDGSSLLSMTGAIGGNVISWLGRFVPGTVEADAELWSSPYGIAFERLDNSATWTQVTTDGENPDFTSTAINITCASFNGKFFLSFKSAQNRLHCYDPTLNLMRRTGVKSSAIAPTAADHGAAGTYGTLRYYRIRWVSVFNGVTAYSEATPSVAFTPDGAHVEARVTKPVTVPSNENITSWLLEASTDNTTFYQLTAVAIATTTYDDSIPTTGYTGYGLSPLTGTYTLQKSYKFIAADQNRLVGFSSWTATDKQNRLEFSALLGSRDECDDERVDTTVNYKIDLDEKDSGVATGLVGPLWGNFYALKSRQIWELAPTGDVNRPYRSTAISKTLGSVSSHASCIGEDADGSPCLYTMTHRGLYRYGAGGMQYISQGIEDLILGPTSTMNMAATTEICHLVYHPDKRQVWVWFAVGSGNDPSVLCVLHVPSGGWTRFTGLMAAARCSVMFANSIGATMGFQLKPYIGAADTVNRVVKCDDASVTADNAVGIQAYVTTRPIAPGGPGYNGRTGDIQILAPVAAGVTITATLDPDFGNQVTKTPTVTLGQSASETRKIKRFTDSQLSSVAFLSITLGDGAAVSNGWSIDQIVIPVKQQEAIT